MRDPKYLINRIADGVELLSGDPEYKAMTQQSIAELRRQLADADVPAPDLYDFLVQASLVLMAQGETAQPVPVIVLDWIRNIIRKQARQRVDADYFAMELTKIIGE